MLRRFSAIGLLMLAVAGCGAAGNAEGCPTNVEDASGVRLTYRAAGATDEDVRTTAGLICRRLEGADDRRPAVAPDGDRIVVVVPFDTSPAIIDYIGTPGRIAFYDWERVLLDESCEIDPARNANDRSPVVGRKRAHELAGRCPGTPRVIRQERTDPAAPEPDAWWIVRDEPALAGEDIVEPAQDLDPETNEPIVTMQFTPAGREKFAAVTRDVARRGADHVTPVSDPIAAAHHFAIVLDDVLISTPFIDYTENPDGISGDTGVQISGGFTTQSAGVLARLLRMGPLPVELELADRRDRR